MTHIKIDAYFVANTNFCTNQTQVVSNASNGCFLLTHDAPTALRQYNSTDNVLQFIQHHPHLFNSSSSIIFLAICFKFDHPNPCDNSSISNKWRSSTTIFITSFTSLITNYNLTIQLVLDGAASFNDVHSNQCLAHLWRPYIKTFSGNPSNPIAKSNNETLGYDRFSILDTQVDDNGIECVNSFDNWVKVGFEKFNYTKQPWLWWEPSSQDCIKQLVGAYNASMFVHESGFYFAINIDIARFKIYSGYKSWNEAMQWKSATNIKHTTHIVASFLSTNNDVVIVTFVSKADAFLYSVSIASETVGNNLNISEWRVSNHANLNDKVLTSVTSVMYDANRWQLFCIGSQDGLFSFLWMDRKTFEVMPVFNYMLSPTQCNSQSMDISAVYVQWKGSSLVVSQVFVCDKTIFGVQRWTQNDNGSFDEFGNVTLIDIKHVDHITDASIVDVNGVHIVIWSANKKIYGVLLDINDGQMLASPMMIGVGDKPRLSLYNDTILMVHGNAYCWLSETHLKQPAPATCDASPVTMDGVLAYSVGSIDDWLRKLMSNESMSVISVCDKYLLHGIYDGGYSPYGTIFVDGNGAQGIVTVHQGIGNSVDHDLNACGAPIKYNDYVLDSWRVP